MYLTQAQIKQLVRIWAETEYFDTKTFVNNSIENDYNTSNYQQTRREKCNVNFFNGL